MPNNIINRTADQSKTRSGITTGAFLIPYGGIKRDGSPAKFKGIGSLSEIVTFGDPTLELQNERTVFELGHKLKTINDGYTLPDFDISFHGNEISTLGAFIGQDFATTPVINHTGTYDQKFALIVMGGTGHGSTASIEVCDLYLNCQVKILGQPGGSDGETQRTISVYSDTPVVKSSGNNVCFATEIWHDDASADPDLTNAAAPNGTLTDFVLGTGNGAYSASYTPTAVSYDGTNYIAQVVVNGEPVETGWSFTSGTNTLTFTTAPADGAKLQVFYAMNTSGSGDYLPHYRNDLTTHDATSGSMWQSWEQYFA